MAESLAGRLIVATPALLDPNFYRTVVLICEHSDDGALGVVLNRPLEDAHLREHLPEWAALVTSPGVLFTGGPVEPATAIALARLRGGHRPDGWAPIIGRTGLLSLAREPADLAGDIDGLRIFSGYAGWGGGQLEGELKQEAWFVVDAEASDPFSGDPSTLWRTVLRRQRGMLATFAFFPEDPHAN